VRFKILQKWCSFIDLVQTASTISALATLKAQFAIKRKDGLYIVLSNGWFGGDDIAPRAEVSAW